MKMNIKIKWSLLIINILCCMSYGCKFTGNYCSWNVTCSTDDIDINYDYKTNMDECSLNTSVSIHGEAYYPLHVKITSEDLIEPLMQEASRYDPVSDIIVSMEITNTSMAITPDFNRMINLKTLNLSHNRLRVADLFNGAELTALENVDLSHNSIAFIKIDNDQHVYKKIRILNLSNNLFTNITGGIFEPFKLLESLDLSFNNIVELDYMTFEGVRNLKYLNLSFNKISEINMSLFRFNYLEELYINNNNIVNISSQNFENLRNLRMLNLAFNQISSIQKDTFNNTESLNTLKLQHNLLNNIEKDIFWLTNKLKVIDLSNNLLKSLPKDFLKNKNITYFSITGNKLDGALSKGTFEGLQLITELDISFQRVNALEDFAFFGLAKLNTLLLNNNNIRNISEHSFDSLISLKQLDLSHNLIVNIGFNKGDLPSLEIFSLGKNFIQQILPEDLQGLNRLRSLDLANNNITKLNSNSFKTLENIESLQLLDNPINGVLLNNTFNGLHLVPVLDLSSSVITLIENGTFSSMVKLKELNISRSSVNQLEYNAFMNTGNIILLDLSYNNLTEFLVNGNDLKNLTILYLNNNAIFQISNYFFTHMVMLSRLIISYNLIQSIDDKSFVYQKYLRYLDISYNSNQTFRTSAINKTEICGKLVLSGVKSEKDLAFIDTIPIKKLDLSPSGVCNVSMVYLNSLTHLMSLNMSNNDIIKLELSALRSMGDLEWLDLSFNKISFIQPGTFRDNVILKNLNLSHNLLISLKYGSLRGLIHLTLLDISYNSICDLKGIKFYDTQKLRTLIADHNKIIDVDNNFFDINLDSLSIGHNPLSCEKIISLKQLKRFNVVALDVDESNDDNIDGIVCNMKDQISQLRPHSTRLNTTMQSVMLDLRDKLSNPSDYQIWMNTSVYNQQSILLRNIFDQLDKNIDNQSMQLENIKSKLVYEINETNSFLEKILKAILDSGSLQKKVVYTDINDTTSNSIKTCGQNYTSMVNSSKANECVYVIQNTEISLLFLEVCTFLILILLICYALCKFYELRRIQLIPLKRYGIDAVENCNL